jgi:hypothetical protein
VEDDLIALCDQSAQGWAAYVLRIAGSGVREYYVYIGDSVGFDRMLPVLLAKHPHYRIEYEETKDSSRSRYTSCLPA